MFSVIILATHVSIINVGIICYFKYEINDNNAFNHNIEIHRNIQ